MVFISFNAFLTFYHKIALRIVQVTYSRML